MNRKINLITIITFVFLMLGSVCFAAEGELANFEHNIRHAFRNGTTLKFVETTGKARASDEQYVTFYGNTIKFIKPGNVVLEVVSDTGESKQYDCFTWNVLLKGDSTDVYSDKSLSNKVGTVYGITYFICEDYGESLLIKDVLYSTGSIDGNEPYANLSGKYIKNYYNKQTGTSSNTYFDYAFDDKKSPTICISLKDFSQKMPSDGTGAGTTEGDTFGGDQDGSPEDYYSPGSDASSLVGSSSWTGSYTAEDESTSYYNSAGDAFLAQCKENVRWLYKNGYGYKSGGSGIPPYKGGTRNSSAKGDSIDCVGFVRWSLYEYGTAQGLEALTKHPYCCDYIPSWYSYAKKYQSGDAEVDWIKVFDVVYTAKDHNSGLGREDGITVAKIKEMLQPGDILVYTGGKRFNPSTSTHGVSQYNSNHIDVFAGFTGEDSAGKIGVKIYSCGDAPKNHQEYAQGLPLTKSYALAHESDSHGFWDVTAVLRLKKSTLNNNGVPAINIDALKSSGTPEQEQIGEIIAHAAEIMYSHKYSFGYNYANPGFRQSQQGIKSYAYLRSGPSGTSPTDYKPAGQKLRFFCDCLGFVRLCVCWSLGENYNPISDNFEFISMKGSVASYLKVLKPGDIMWFEGHYAVYVGNGKLIHIVNRSNVPNWDTWRAYKDSATDIWCSQSLKGVYRIKASAASKINIETLDVELTRIQW